MRSVNQILQDGKQIYSVTQQKREKLKAKWLQAGGCSEAGMEDFRVQDWRITQLLHSPYPFCVENWLPAPNTKHTYRVAFCRDCLRKSLNSGAPGTDEGTLITLTPITFPHLTPLESWQTGLYTKGRRKKKSNSKELQLPKTVYQQNSWVSVWFPSGRWNNGLQRNLYPNPWMMSICYLARQKGLCRCD